MDIFAFAMQFEKNGEVFYRDLAAKTDQEGLTTIFTMLANAEVKHYNIVRQMQKDASNIRLEDDRLFDNVKNVFAGMRDEKPVFDTTSAQIDLYKKARDIEVQSRDFYQEKADKASDNAQKTILLKLAKEEDKHRVLLDNIIELVSRPDTWLENAEWVHLDEY